MYLTYTCGDTGGINVNEFENDPQSKDHDILGGIKGFTFSFLFFAIIFFIGFIISSLG